VPAPAPEPDEDAEILTSDIDAMFEDDEDPEPFQSFISSDDAEPDLDEDFDIDDSDGIPEVFSADEQDPDLDIDRPRPWGKVIGITLAVIIVALLTGLFFLKDTVVKFVPQLNGVYDMIGFHSLGDGLQIQKVQFSQETEAGLEVLVVSGQIQNVTDDVRPVPMIRALLYDGDGNELQHADTPPLRSELAAQKNLTFKVRIKEPSQLRRNVKVTFTEAPKMDSDNEGGHEEKDGGHR